MKRLTTCQKKQQSKFEGEMLERANKRAEEERRKEETKDSLDQFFGQKRKSGLLTPTKTL